MQIHYIMRIIKLLLALFPMGVYAQVPKTEEMIAIQKEHLQWFVEQTVENISNKKLVSQKDSTIHDLNNVVHEQQMKIASYRKDSIGYIMQISTLNFKSNKFESAYKIQDHALTQVRKKEGILKLGIIGIAALLVLSIIHPL